MSGNTKSKQMSMLAMRQQIANVRSKAADDAGAILIGRKVKAPPIRSEDERLEMLKGWVDDELGQLHKTNALLIAAQFAANHECEFDVSDALAAIIARVERHIETLDALCLKAAR